MREETAPPPRVRAYLLADISHVAPGQEFSLGVRLDIEPSWHIYWLNPGEAGLPTQATFEVPARFSTGDVRYPGPTRFESAGDIIGYGYTDIALISVPVTAPDDLAPGEQLRFAAEVSWLACREECIPGSSSNQMQMAVADPTTPSSPSHPEFWRDHLARVPSPWSELAGAASSWHPGAAEDVLELHLPGADRAEYFPSAAEQPVMSGQAAIPADGAVSLRISYRSGSKAAAPPAIRGVVRIETGGSARYVNLDLPWPKES